MLVYNNLLCKINLLKMFLKKTRTLNARLERIFNQSAKTLNIK